MVSSTTIDILSKSINFFSKFIVGFVGFIYFLADMEKIRHWFRNLLLSISNKTYKYLNHFVQENLEYTTMEISSEALYRNRTNTLNLDVAIITNITEDHLSEYCDE